MMKCRALRVIIILLAINLPLIMLMYRLKVLDHLFQLHKLSFDAVLFRFMVSWRIYLRVPRGPPRPHLGGLNHLRVMQVAAIILGARSLLRLLIPFLGLMLLHAVVRQVIAPTATVLVFITPMMVVDNVFVADILDHYGCATEEHRVITTKTE